MRSALSRQRSKIILAQDADILLLDEPMNHLDIGHQYDVLSLMRGFLDQGRTVVAVLQDLNLAGRFADRVAFMDKGEVIAHGATANILTRQRIAQVFKIGGGIINLANLVVFLPEARDIIDDQAAE